MARKVSVTLPDWLYADIEGKRGKTNRSEFITEKVIKGMKGVQE